jgi:ribosomal protein S18 acetylase RimI-like enzyme
MAEDVTHSAGSDDRGKNPQGIDALLLIRQEHGEKRDERGTANAFQMNGVLYAYVGDQLIGALDFTQAGHDVCINVLYVKSGFRRRGVGTALTSSLLQRHPGSTVRYASSRKSDDSGRTSA